MQLGVSLGRRAVAQKTYAPTRPLNPRGEIWVEAYPVILEEGWTLDGKWPRLPQAILRRRIPLGMRGVPSLASCVCEASRQSDASLG